MTGILVSRRCSVVLRSLARGNWQGSMIYAQTSRALWRLRPAKAVALQEGYAAVVADKSKAVGNAL